MTSQTFDPARRQTGTDSQMHHLAPFRRRKISALDPARGEGWHLKRYAILAESRVFDPAAVDVATQAALKRLPPAGALNDADNNHGVGVQLFHFSEEIPLVSPVFYWRWGSVLFNAHQLRSYSETPYEIVDGVRDVVGCIWEMELVSFEVRSWRDIVLTEGAEPAKRIEQYLAAHASDATIA